MKFLSNDETFFDHFRQLAVHIRSAAGLLRAIFEDPSIAERIAADIRRVKMEADQVVQEIHQRIDTSFVTPLDREDIHLLSSRLTTVIDLINSAARDVVIFRVNVSREGGVEMAGILERAGAGIQASIDDLSKRQHTVARGRTMQLLGDEGDARYAESVGALFDHEHSAIEVLKWKEIFDVLDKAIHACNAVSTVLQSIAVKNS